MPATTITPLNGLFDDHGGSDISNSNNQIIEICNIVALFVAVAECLKHVLYRDM